MKFNWCARSETYLRSLWMDGGSASNIALRVTEEYGNGLTITRSAILGKVHRMKLPARITPEEKEAGKERARLERERRRTKRQNDRDDVFRQKLKRRNFLGHTVTPSKQVDIEPDLFEVTHDPVALIDLERHHCRWPIGEGASTMYCGSFKTYGSYCRKHWRLAYQPASTRNLERLAA